MQVAKADKIRQVTELRQKRAAQGFSLQADDVGSIGLATLSKLKRRARSLTTHVHRYKGLLAPQTPMVCAKIVSPATVSSDSAARLFQGITIHFRPGEVSLT